MPLSKPLSSPKSSDVTTTNTRTFPVNPEQFISHGRLISLIRTFHPDMDEGGICNGYTSMWLQASLHPNPEIALESFYERLDLISEYSISSPDFKGIDEDRLKHDIDNIYQKQKDQTNKVYKPSESEWKLLDLRSFCDAIALQQSPELFPEVFLKYACQNDKETIYPFTYSRAFEEGATNFSVNDLGPIACTQDTLTEHLKSMEEILHNPNISGHDASDNPLGFLLVSDDHAVGLKYLGDQKWRFMDINDLARHNTYSRELEIAELASSLFKSFWDDKNEYTLINFTAITTSKNSKLPEAFEALNKSQNQSVISENPLNSRGFSLLHMAAMEGNPKAVNYLLESGLVDVNKANKGYERFWAFLRSFFIESRADVNQADNEGWTPLCLAAQNGCTETAKLLIESGANVNQSGNKWLTPLYWAAQEGHTQVAKLLIESGADVNRAGILWITPLHVAAQEGHTETAKLLIESGAKVNQASILWGTPLHLAAQEGHTETVNLLKEIERIKEMEPSGFRGLSYAYELMQATSSLLYSGWSGLRPNAGQADASASADSRQSQSSRKRKLGASVASADKDSGQPREKRFRRDS